MPGSPYPYDFKNKKRFPGGTVEVRLRIENDRVADVRFHGDFFGDAPVEELAKRLVGVPLRPDAVLERLAEVKTEEYFRGVTAAEIASLFA